MKYDVQVSGMQMVVWHNHNDNHTSAVQNFALLYVIANRSTDLARPAPAKNSSVMNGGLPAMFA